MGEDWDDVTGDMEMFELQGCLWRRWTQPSLTFHYFMFSPIDCLTSYEISGHLFIYGKISSQRWTCKEGLTSLSLQVLKWLFRHNSTIHKALVLKRFDFAGSSFIGRSFTIRSKAGHRTELSSFHCQYSVDNEGEGMIIWDDMKDIFLIPSPSPRVSTEKPISLYFIFIN